VAAGKELVKTQVVVVSQEANAKLAEEAEVARQAVAIVARAAAKAAAKARAAAKKAARKAARKAAAKPRKYMCDGQCWERVGSYATAKKWYFECLFKTLMAGVMPAPLATLIVEPKVANAVGDSPGAKSAMAATKIKPCARLGVKGRRTKARKEAAVIKAQREAKRQASEGKKSEEAVAVSKAQRKAKKDAADLRTGELREARAVTLARRAAQKAANESETFKAKARNADRQLIEQAKLRVAASHARTLEQDRIALMEFRVKCDAMAAVAKGLRDRETTGGVESSFQAAEGAKGCPVQARGSGKECCEGKTCGGTRRCTPRDEGARPSGQTQA
jgi:hypothetical protein